MLKVINERTYLMLDNYGNKRCGNKNIVIDRSKFDDELEYYRVRIHIYEIEVPSEEAMDCIFKNISLNIVSLNSNEISYYFSNHIDTAKFDTRFGREAYIHWKRKQEKQDEID